MRPDKTETDQNRSAWAIGIIQLVFVIAVIGSAMALSQALKGNGSDRRPQLSDLRSESKVTVRVVQPEQVSFAPQVRANGTVQANAEVIVSPQVSGEIRRVSSTFRAGSMIKKGDLLFEIERADYLLAVERAEAEIAAASSDLAQLEAEAQLAVVEWEELFPDREVNDLAARIPQIEAARARLGSANANMRTAELALQRTRVYAPVDARILSSSLDIGQIVAPGQSLGRLVALDSIEIALPVSTDQLAILEPVVGRRANLQQKGGTSEEQSAQVVRVDATLDERTRLSNLYLAPETKAGLRIGDFFDVIITSNTVNGALVIPATALSGQSKIWVVDNGQLASREITVLGARADGEEIVAMPFNIGEGVVAVPPQEAEEGQDVFIPEKPSSITAISGGRADGAQ